MEHVGITMDIVKVVRQHDYEGIRLESELHSGRWSHRSSECWRPKKQFPYMSETM